MVSKATEQLARLLQSEFPRLDSAYLENVAERLLAELGNVQKSGETSSASLKLSLRKITWVAQEMRRQREAKGLSQTEFGRQIDKSLTWVIRRETCVNPYTVADVVALISFFGIKDKGLIDRLTDSVRRNR